MSQNLNDYKKNLIQVNTALCDTRDKFNKLFNNQIQSDIDYPKMRIAS